MPTPLILFAPGAGAPSTSAWMKAWKRRLETLGKVVTLDYPYMVEGRRSPDKQPKLIEAHRQALEAARQGHKGSVVLAGKSMGGRMGCHVALEEKIDGLVCLGYPLKGAGKRASIRDEVLVALRTPVLFVQGTRDPLCPLDLLDEVRPRMTARNELLVVEGGNHSLEVTATALRAASETQADVDARILRAIADFIAKL
jgi:predicted alpha/beta-hydrolase family hydrolase